MKKGDIVIVRFPFTDLSGEKLRPALVLREESRIGDIILAFITTQLDQLEEHDMLLSSEHHNFEKTGLRKQSVLKLNRIVTLNKRIIIGRIGTLSEEYLKQVNIKLKNMLRL